EESDEEDPEESMQGGRTSARHIKWPVQEVLSRTQVVKQIVDDLLQLMQESLSESFMPVLQPGIGVGSTFEGWSPYEPDDVIYHVLVPLKPPTGHTFHLQWGTRGSMPAKHSYILVEVECTCEIQNMPCSVHHSRKHPKRMKQAPSLLDTLCTNSYLDVEKIAEWFQCLAKEAWVALPQAHYYEMKVLPYSQRSCPMKLKSAYKKSTLFIEILFGVQQGVSDIFLSSQSTGGTNTPSTLWIKNYLVAEGKFFSHVARQVPHGSFHLKCLHLCTSILDNTNFTPYMFKTVVMHLLNTKPMSGWCRRECVMRLVDILKYLHCCLEQKKLNFFFGNGKMPQEIILPPDFHTSEPHNLLHHLVQSPAAHAEALRQFEKI
ncbi:IPIL1 protein, partial [Eubucco bourcierii]|nr:IPIL1 protein [Eubucco bourcierii]